MNKTLNTMLLVTLILVLAGGAFFAGTVYARSSGFGMSWMMNMMGNGGNTNPGGIMNMMGGYADNNADLTPLTVDQAKAAAETYLANLKNDDLQIAEVMVFDNNAYIVIKEASTGVGAFELLADSTSETAYPEYGPNMMWNLKYSGINHQYMMNGTEMMGGNGMMSGMMDGSGSMMSGWDDTTPTDISAAMTVTPKEAIEYAQKYMDANLADATAGTDPITFYGYYTLDFVKDGKVAGMLSVNAYSGQVFLHTWHGTFIEETE
jgi:hypothetical protein